jgi:hypothetical protein
VHFFTPSKAHFSVPGLFTIQNRRFYTAKSPGPKKWALLGAKKSTDVGLGVLYNPSFGSVLIRVLNRVLVRSRLQVAITKALSILFMVFSLPKKGEKAILGKIVLEILGSRSSGKSVPKDGTRNCPIFLLTPIAPLKGGFDEGALHTQKSVTSWRMTMLIAGYPYPRGGIFLGGVELGPGFIQPNIRHPLSRGGF